MRYRRGIDTKLKILTQLAVKKEYAQYDMPKVIGKDYHTVLRHLKILERQQLIQLNRTEPAKKHGKDRKIYTLTDKGIIVILNFINSYDHIDEIAENYASNFPYIFGKWHFFIENGLRDMAIDRLQDTILATIVQIKDFPDLDYYLFPGYLEPLEKAKPRLELFNKDDMTTHFLLFPLVTSFTIPLHLTPYDSQTFKMERGKKWMATIRKDEELKKYAYAKISLAQVHFKKATELLEPWLQALLP